MPADCTYLSYQDTGYFSKLVTDYLEQATSLSPFYKFVPNMEGLDEAIAARKDFPVDRKLLVEVLQKQYAGLPQHEAVTANFASLQYENTYTVCTAHQPNLLTGYLYFVYKILHAIRLSEALNERHPNKHFVPVYYMGSEDNDLEELGTFRYEGKKYIWDAEGQQGAVGRMRTQSLKPLIAELYKVLGPPGPHLDALKELLEAAYLQHETIGAATQYLVHQLFGKYGLIVIDPDDARLKGTFVEVMRDDLLHQQANDLVSRQAAALSEIYKAQAFPRPINLFYLIDGLRARIEQQGDKWIVIDTDIAWTEEALLEELRSHPERFSPNVILRGLFQETILPNVAFIGGGAEVAYWLQLKPVFEHYHVFYPVILLRQSVQIVDAQTERLRKQLGLEIKELFLPELELTNQYIASHSEDDITTIAEEAELKDIIFRLKNKATHIDQTLEPAAMAALTKMLYQLQVLQKKMLRAEKRKMQVQVDRINKLKAMSFPDGGLQERVENFMPYYLAEGPAFFDRVKAAIQPDANTFIVLFANDSHQA